MKGIIPLFSFPINFNLIKTIKNRCMLVLPCLVSSSLIAQNFEEISDTPFEELKHSWQLNCMTQMIGNHF